MNIKKKSLRSRIILQFPLLIFLIIYITSFYWLSDFFVELGVKPKDTFFIQLAVIITLLIGYLTATLYGLARSKLK